MILINRFTKFASINGHRTDKHQRLGNANVLQCFTEIHRSLIVYIKEHLFLRPCLGYNMGFSSSVKHHIIMSIDGRHLFGHINLDVIIISQTNGVDIVCFLKYRSYVITKKT